jgi:hypothetical protein
MRFIDTHTRLPVAAPHEHQPIRAKADYEAALAEVGGLMSAKCGTPTVDRLNVLVTLIEVWESRHFPTSPPDPAGVIKFHQGTSDQSALARHSCASWNPAPLCSMVYRHWIPARTAFGC